jgi:PTS system mannose-specific IIB component/fructoselysine and glucoselysine-specific PTS system IIB component
MGIEIFRVDDRLIHGQVVVGWGQPLDVRFIVLVDDEVAASAWEQDLYRMGVPEEMEVAFESVGSAIERMDVMLDDPRGVGILLTADVGTMQRLVAGSARIRRVNLGGIHHRAGRVQRMRYIFLSPDEEAALLAMQEGGVQVEAQDVPAAAPVPLAEILAGDGAR